MLPDNMRYTLRISMCVLLANSTCLADANSSFLGWQAMRVIAQDGYPVVLQTADLESDGREELLVVNTRHSRLDVYRWLPPDQRGKPETRDRERPNDLPMAPDFEHDEIQMERLPQDLLVHDIDGDQSPELVMLTTSPNKVLVYDRQDGKSWRKTFSLDLLPGEIQPAHRALILREPVIGEFELLISCDDGVQRLTLEPNSRVDWLKPRERQGRNNWWLADLDGDRDLDLVEHSLNSDQSIRWYPCGENGRLLPAQALHDRPVKDLVILGRPDRAHILALENAGKGLLRRYELQAGASNPLGRHRAVAATSGTKTAWCGLDMAGKPALVISDQERPQVMTYLLHDAGWVPDQTYAMISGIRQIVAAQAEPGTVLIWAKDASDLQRSRWDNGRLSYPRPWKQSAEVEDRKIVTLASAGRICWWVQRVGEDLDLYRWEPGSKQPKKTRFKGIGKVSAGRGKKKDVDQAMWVGEQRLLFKGQWEKTTSLAVRNGEETVVSQPPHLQKAKLAEFQLIPDGNRLRPARLTGGVLQWLNDDLHSINQIMLPQGLKLVGYVGRAKGQGWALQEDGQYIHSMEAQTDGMAKSTWSVRVGGGTSLVNDPVLGLMLVGQNRLTKLSEGKPDEMHLIDTADHRTGRAGEAKGGAIHRIAGLDIMGNGQDEIVFFDDRRHQMTVLCVKEGKFEPVISWPVFEDKKYPYSNEKAPVTPRPRTVVTLDVDGDRQQDLAMLCHDRLIFYLAREHDPDLLTWRRGRTD